MGESRDPLATGKILWVQPWLLGKCVMPKGLGSVPCSLGCSDHALLPCQSSRAPGHRGTLVPRGRNGDVPHCQGSPPLPQRGFPQGLLISRAETRLGNSTQLPLAPGMGLVGFAWQQPLQKPKEEPRCEPQSPSSAVRCSELCLLRVVSILMSSSKAIEETNTRPTAK